MGDGDGKDARIGLTHRCLPHRVLANTTSPKTLSAHSKKPLYTINSIGKIKEVNTYGEDKSDSIHTEGTFKKEKREDRKILYGSSRGSKRVNMKSRKIECICKQCKKEFRVYPSQIRKGEGHYCSQYCYGKSRRLKLKTSKKILNKLHWLENKSINEIARIYKCASGVIATRFKEYGIPNRTWRESVEIIIRKPKINKICVTCHKKFEVVPAREPTSKYCSKKCYDIAQEKKIIKHCKICGKKFYTTPCNEKRKYCSMKCRDKDPNSKKPTKRFKKKCLVCKSEFTTIPGKPKNNFCSTECYHKFNSGERCHLWQGGIAYEPYSYDFIKKLRKQISLRDNHVCQLCGKGENGRKLPIHHIDYNKKNNNPLNLITLCIRCHMKTNFNRQYWTALFKIKMNQIPQQNGYIDLVKFTEELDLNSVRSMI